MSQIDRPKDKPKYNNHDAFRWVDSQWEKFMMEQKKLKSEIFEKDNIIKQLQEDLVTCNKHFQRQRGELMNLVSRIPSSYLTDRSKGYTIEHTKQWLDWSGNKRNGNDRRWDGVDRRESDRRNDSKQLELFESNDVD